MDFEKHVICFHHGFFFININLFWFIFPIIGKTNLLYFYDNFMSRKGKISINTNFTVSSWTDKMMATSWTSSRQNILILNILISNNYVIACTNIITTFCLQTYIIRYYENKLQKKVRLIKNLIFKNELYVFMDSWFIKIFSYGFRIRFKP